MLCSYGCNQEATFTTKSGKPCCSATYYSCPGYLKKLSDSKSGSNHPLYGKCHSKETKELFSKSRQGENNSFYGKHHTKESKDKINKTKKENGTEPIGENNPMYGKVRTQEEREKISATRVAKGIAKKENNPNWRGGISKNRKSDMATTKYKCWRLAVFERDNYTCCICGIRGGYLEAHHIIQWSDNELLRYDISNGQTLCKKCHIKTFKKGS